jgi:hypothetical protein
MNGFEGDGKVEFLIQAVTSAIWGWADNVPALVIYRAAACVWVCLAITKADHTTA